MTTTTVDELVQRFDSLSEGEKQAFQRRLQLPPDELARIEKHIQRAREASAAGRVVDHADVKRWVKSLRTERPLDPPRCN